MPLLKRRQNSLSTAIRLAFLQKRETIKIVRIFSLNQEVKA